MKNASRAAIAASALALAWSWNFLALADEESRVTISGTILPACSIDAQHILGGGVGALMTGAGTSRVLNYSIPGSNAFANDNGEGLAFSGEFLVPVVSVGHCEYTLTSRYGALWNSSANAARGYSADAHIHGEPSSLVLLDSHSENRTFRTFVATGNKDITIEFSAAASGMLAAGEYTDILQLRVVPHS
jgi:hypothetical protein